MKLELAKDFSLPPDAVTQTIAVLAKRRAGKSYTARRFAEQLFRIGQQVIVVDPKGDWWGMRSSGDGKSAGLPITILGGEHGDAPLEPGAGELVASVAVEENVRLLLDVSAFRKHEVATFMAAFLETLYRLKAQERYRTPVMLILDEADAIAPQKPYRGEERMLGAAEDIVRRGGQRGIGTMLVTQRSAVLNKNVLTQSEVLVALRTIAPQDMEAMDAWIEKHGTSEQRKILMESLPSLPIGDAWFWSPGWPTEAGIFRRVHVLPIETFDSGATPRPGEKRVQPKRLADVDLAALRQRMSATIERARENDPKLLRAEVARLRAEMGRAQAANPELTAARESEVRKEAARSVHRDYGEIILAIADAADKLNEALVQAQHLARFVDTITEPRRLRASPSIEGRRIERPAPARAGAAGRAVSSGGGRNGGGALPAMHRAMLSALAQHPAGLTKAQVRLHAGYADSGPVSTAFAEFQRNCWTQTDGRLVRITSEGIAVLGPFEPLPTGSALLELLLAGEKLSKVEKALLRAVVEAGGDAVRKGAAREAAGYADSGPVSTAFARLLRYGYLEARGAGAVRLARELRD